MNRKLLRIAASIVIAAFVQQVRSSQLKNSSPNAPVIPQASVQVYPEKAGVGPTLAKETVSVIHPEKSEAATLQLPGQLSAYTDAPIYAQTSGYLKSWSFDIGAKVRANDILGEIDTPEVDQALAQAKAQLQVDQSALKLAQVTYRRYQLLFVQKVLDGAYAEITFKFTGDFRFLTIPENTLLFRREGPAVGIVHSDGKVEIRKITINRDFGNKLEVSEGLSISDQVILNPSDSLSDGPSLTKNWPRQRPNLRWRRRPSI
jgi:multidrug efflux pump subunit AcrA (membrane-fusion protein)